MARAISSPGRVLKRRFPEVASGAALPTEDRGKRPVRRQGPHPPEISTTALRGRDPLPLDYLTRTAFLGSSGRISGVSTLREGSRRLANMAATAAPTRSAGFGDPPLGQTRPIETAQAFERALGARRRQLQGLGPNDDINPCAAKSALAPRPTCSSDTCPFSLASRRAYIVST